MIKRVAVIIGLVLAVHPLFGDVVIRNNLGLYGGQIENLATFDMPGSPNRVYADVLGSNALYYTDDEGMNWIISITDTNTYGLATDSTYVYVAVDSMEILRSPGGDGLTWTTILDPTYPVYFGEPIMSVQHDGTRLMLGCNNGVAYFNPTGNPADWSRHVISPSGPDIGVTSMASRPSDPNTILAVMNNTMNPDVTHNQLHISIDGGATWNPVALPPTITRAIEIVAEDPNHADYVYLAGDSAYATIYENQSFLDPATWTDITPGSFEFHYPQNIAFHNNLLWTTSHTYDVTTGGWTPHPLTTVGTHVNDGALAHDPDNPNLVFAASDVGVAVSADGAVTFEERNTNIEAVGVFDVDVDIITKDVALVASKSGLAITNVFQLPPTPADWTYPVFPQGTGGAPLTAAAILLDSTQEFIAGSSNETIFYSTNGGATWTQAYKWLGSPIESRSMVTDIDHAAGSNTLYAGIGFTEEGNDGVVVRSDDRGHTWTPTTLSGVYPNTLEIVGTNLVYVGTGHERDLPSITNTGLWVTANGGTTWNQVVTTAGPYTGIVTDLAQDPIDPKIQYMTLQIAPDTGVVIQIEYDASGVNVVGNMDLTMLPGAPAYGQFTAIETNDSGQEVFVGVDENIFMFDVTSSTWSLYFTGHPGETIYRLYWDDLVIGTSAGFYSFVRPSSAVQNWMNY